MRFWDMYGTMSRHFDNRGKIVGRVVHMYYENIFLAIHEGSLIGEFYSADEAMSAVERANNFQ
jgi:hypothetical protein